MKQIKLPFQKISSVNGKPPLSKKSHPTILDSDDEESYSQPSEDEFISDISDLDLPNELITRMYPHQKEGVQWLYSLHLSQPGGILGDDMGLGKTFQVACLLTGLMRNNLIQRALIVAPVSVLQSWERELRQHLQPYVKRIGIDIVNADMIKKKRQQILHDVFLSKNQKIVITSYHLVGNMMDDFAGQGTWDYLILDEGHIIKNPSTKISKSMRDLPSKHRLLLTGTPIQNHLTEFWALIDWATEGKILGSKIKFVTQFADKILAGQDPKASKMARDNGEQAVKLFMALIRPILLQRKKCEKQESLNLNKKVELVVWVPLSTKQRSIYDQYLKSHEITSALQRCNFPVEIINHLKTLSRHPFLLEASQMQKKRNEKLKKKKSNSLDDDDDDDDIGDLSDALNSMSIAKKSNKNDDNEDEDLGVKISSTADVFEIAERNPDKKELLQGSIKLRVLIKLLRRLLRNNHRVLVFSQSKMMLDIIQLLLIEYEMSSYRIDGSIKGKDRQNIIDEFNDLSNGENPSICLLTTRACGYGITLTGADRVIIFDPSWNPAEDRQAVDRAFRIGQTKDVVVYRMIMASSVEEKMYEKQVFKDGLRVVTESGTSSRYFSQSETKGLFTLGPIDHSVVMERLWAHTGEKITSYEDTKGDLEGVLGFSRHDNLYEESRPEDVQKRSAIPSGKSKNLNSNPSINNSNSNSNCNKSNTYVSIGKKIPKRQINADYDDIIDISIPPSPTITCSDGSFSTKTTNTVIDLCDSPDLIPKNSIINNKSNQFDVSDKIDLNKEYIDINNDENEGFILLNDDDVDFGDTGRVSVINKGATRLSILQMVNNEDLSTDDEEEWDEDYEIIPINTTIDSVEVVNDSDIIDEGDGEDERFGDNLDANSSRSSDSQGEEGEFDDFIDDNDISESEDNNSEDEDEVNYINNNELIKSVPTYKRTGHIVISDDEEECNEIIQSINKSVTPDRIKSIVTPEQNIRINTTRLESDEEKEEEWYENNDNNRSNETIEFNETLTSLSPQKSSPIKNPSTPVQTTPVNSNNEPIRMSTVKKADKTPFLINFDNDDDDDDDDDDDEIDCDKQDDEISGQDILVTKSNKEEISYIREVISFDLTEAIEKLTINKDDKVNTQDEITMDNFILNVEHEEEEWNENYDHDVNNDNSNKSNNSISKEKEEEWYENNDNNRSNETIEFSETLTSLSPQKSSPIKNPSTPVQTTPVNSNNEPIRMSTVKKADKTPFLINFDNDDDDDDDEIDCDKQDDEITKYKKDNFDAEDCNDNNNDEKENQLPEVLNIENIEKKINDDNHCKKIVEINEVISFDLLDTIGKLSVNQQEDEVNTIDPNNNFEDLNFDIFKKVKVSLINKDICNDITGNLLDEYTKKSCTNINSASSVATLEASLLRSKKLIIFFKPRLQISNNDDLIKQYNKFILEAQSAERKKDKEMAVALYAAAISITDEDVLLHGKIAYLSKKIGIKI